MNTITFKTGDGRDGKIIQRLENGNALIIVTDAQGNHEPIPDAEAFITPEDFDALIRHFRACKREGKPVYVGEVC